MTSFLNVLKILWNGTSTAVAIFYYSWGLFYARWGMVNRAFWYMNKAVIMNSTNPKGYFHRASLYTAVGNHHNAILDYTAAINLDPDYVDAYTRRGMMYTLLDKDDEANEDFDRAVQLGIDRQELENEVIALRRSR